MGRVQGKGQSDGRGTAFGQKLTSAHSRKFEATHIKRCAHASNDHIGTLLLTMVRVLLA